MFDEKYVTRVKSSSSGVAYELLTRNDGYYKAETRMGGGKFESSEAPNIKALLRKAGRSDEDRPPIV